MGDAKNPTKIRTIAEFAKESEIAAEYLRGYILGMEDDLPMIGSRRLIDDDAARKLAPIVARIKSRLIPYQPRKAKATA